LKLKFLSIFGNEARKPLHELGNISYDNSICNENILTPFKEEKR
jgi:hypothetical protein